MCNHSVSGIFYNIYIVFTFAERVNDKLTSHQFMQNKKQTRQLPGTRLSKGQAYPIIEQYFKSGLM
ncbi:hypothetical protein D0T57_08020, partial [Dysgonomonas sp. 511]|nr:hypothetical protein [Dysgonomonas sp. 511]